MKKFTAFIVALLLVAVPLTAVNAARFERGDMVTITESELVAQNLYLAGGQVTFSSTAQKDLIMAGGKLIVNGPVWGDILAAGGTVDILEDVRGDIRVVGGQVSIQGTVSGDVTVAGGQVSILPGTVIAGDLIVAGGQITMDGSVNGQTKIYGGQIHVDGLLAGPVFITAQDSVEFGSKAVIGSTLTYRAPKAAVMVEGAKIGDKVTYVQLDLPNVDSGAVAKALLILVSAIFVIKLIALAVTSALVATLFRDFSLQVTRETFSRFWYMALIGLGVVVIGPVLAIVLMATLVGLYIGLIVWALYFLVLLLGAVFLAITGGALIAKLVKKEVRVDWKWAVLGAVVVALVSLIPIAGWVATGLLYLGALGALVAHLYRAVQARMQ